MNVTQGVGSCSYLSYLNQPDSDTQSEPDFEDFDTQSEDFDTQSATASGQWKVCKSTSKLLPSPSRESERQKLLLAAESGRLGLRRIDLFKEEEYLSGKRAPRPCTLALPGAMMPTERVSESHGEWMVGIVDPQCLYVYKRNAWTSRLLEPGFTPEGLKVKLLPDLQSALDRRFERGEQVIWRVYPRFTSGHLQADGTFSLPKFKPGQCTRSKDFPELVLTHYRREDIKCFCVYNDAQKNISDILRDKRQCEEVLELDPLPLVVYCHRTGSVQVYFEDELDTMHLTGNERSLNDFAVSHQLYPDTFRALLNLLPVSLRAKTLSSKLTFSSMHKLQQAIELVSDPCSYSYEKLLELKQSGLPIHKHFIYEGRSVSLLDLLLLSEIGRNNEPEHEQTREHEKEACRLLQLLLQSGAKLDEAIPFIKDMDDCTSEVIPANVMNYIVAAFDPFDFMTLKHLERIPLIGCPGNVVEFNRICQGLSQEQIQHRMIEVLDVSFEPPPLDMIKSHLLALFHYGARLDEVNLDSLIAFLDHYCRRTMKIADNFTVADFIPWVKALWDERNTYPLFQNWPEHLEQAEKEIKDLKKSLSLNDSGPSPLKFIEDAFSTAPVLPDLVGDNEETILKVLQHYYRRPGPERVIRSLRKPTLPTLWKPLHSCSHVLRARNNGHWYMELLEKFQQCSLRQDEKELLSLAIIYHDAAAEDVDKSAEETRSAEYFKRDLAGYYPEALLADMAEAMISKENDVQGKDEQYLSESVRWYLRILRFADRTDVIRGCGVGADFPGLTATPTRGFNAGRLDLPVQLTEEFTSEPDNKSEFQRHLEAAMHGAADLARVTGRLNDQRNKDYSKVYGLIGNGSKISGNFEWTTEPVKRMNQFIDDNVRRKIAREAGIIVCSDPDHRACKADQDKGITYGIHNSWYDLRQVELPAGMTLLEKMQYEHDPSLLSPATQQALEQEVQRLRREGIRMNPGTLTQETLLSPKAQSVLEDRGIKVVGEKRPYFNNEDDSKGLEMLVPKKIAKPDAQSKPTEVADSRNGKRT
ncbi:hypothetical protein [Endozoicomonas sp. 8E]|uniref:hypothetical protein n=1 Tax=Endozoicomonas sp. 8E TaxID=3035692 RepID=UPI002938EA40|nr:hypothetical protein [Endozoicomonas sp. 8E]WOG29146.1 hypothetical protein P6910_05630 [Endozoicomonas sp. 8E]